MFNVIIIGWMKSFIVWYKVYGVKLEILGSVIIVILFMNIF